MTKFYPALLVLGIWLVLLVSAINTSPLKAKLTPPDVKVEVYDPDEARRAFWEMLTRTDCR